MTIYSFSYLVSYTYFYILKFLFYDYNISASKLCTVRLYILIITHLSSDYYISLSRLWIGIKQSK